MNTDYLKEFTVLAECLNYTQAARTLFISPTALSSHVKKLEQELDVPLVRTISDTVLLTPAGKALLRNSDRFICALDTLITECQNAKAIQSLRVAIDHPSQFIQAVNNACYSFSANNKQTAFEVETVLTMANGIKALKQSKVDLALLSLVHVNSDSVDLPIEEGFECRFLFKENVIFSVMQENSLFSKPKISAQDLSGQTLLANADSSWKEVALQLVSGLEKQGIYMDLETTPLVTSSDYLFGTNKQVVRFWQEHLAHQLQLEQYHSMRCFTLEDLSVDYLNFIVYRTDDATPELRTLFELIAPNSEEALQAALAK